MSACVFCEILAERLPASVVYRDEICAAFLADGESAGQEVFHIHLHVFPRFTGDGFGLKFGPHYSQKPERNELEMVTAKLRAAWPES